MKRETLAICISVDILWNVVAWVKSTTGHLNTLLDPYRGNHWQPFKTPIAQFNLGIRIADYVPGKIRCCWQSKPGASFIN
jgi:hypothetical protein